jgi:bla regulator protein blaR1
MHGAAPGGAVVDGVAVVVTDTVGPATAGFWRSRVLVPHWVLSLPEAERRYVLRHEDEHRRAHDVHLLLATSLMLVVTPWNLALWWQLHRLGLAVEMDCDSRVVTALGDPASYGHALLSVAQVATRGPRLGPGFVGGAASLERRLAMLVTPDRLRHFQRVLLPALAIVLLLLALTVPHPVTVEHLPHR